MNPEDRVPERLRDLAAKSPIAAMIVGQHARQVAGATSPRTVDTKETSSHRFGRFAAAHGRMDASTFEAFHLDLEASNLAPASKQGYYQDASALARGLMDRGEVARFRIPHRYDEAQVRAVTPPPPRLVDGLADGVTGVDDGELLQKVVEWTYNDLDRWREKRAFGRKIMAASADAFRAAEAQAELCKRGRMDTGWMPGFIALHSTEMADFGVPIDAHEFNALAYCLNYAVKHFDGVPLTHAQFDALGDPSRAGRYYRYKLGQIGMAAPGLFASMLVPCHDQAAALAILLAAAMVNADSIGSMDHLQCLRPGLEKGVSLLCWTKPRAGGELPGTAFEDDDRASMDADDERDGADVDSPDDERRMRPVRDKGGRNPGWSIVPVIKDYRASAEPLRRRIDPSTGLSTRLVVCQPSNAFMDGNVPEVPSANTLWRAVTRLAARCAANLAVKDPGLAGLTFTLRAVRVSSIQHFNRSAGGLAATAAAAKQRSRAVTADYVDTPELRAGNTAEARDGQEKMAASIRDGTLVVRPEDAPPGVQPIGHGAGCRDRMASPIPGARPGSPCEEFIACLGCINTIVVATPLNYALLSRFRDHLQGDGDRRYREPEAYDRWVRPALERITRVLASFPPDVAQAGAAIAPKLDINFGVIW